MHNASINKKIHFLTGVQVVQGVVQYIVQTFGSGRIFFVWWTHDRRKGKKKQRGGGQKARAELYVTHSYYFLKKSIFSRECMIQVQERVQLLCKALETGEYFLFGGHIVGRKKKGGGGQKACANNIAPPCPPPYSPSRAWRRTGRGDVVRTLTFAEGTLLYSRISHAE